MMKYSMQFPKWTKYVPLVGGLTLLIGGLLTIVALYTWANFDHTDVGYRPKQPVAFSHKMHAGELGLDCRYCHSSVEKNAHANIPATETCMNCHKFIKTDSPEIAKVRASYVSGKPIEWVKVHRLADYAYFDHSRHLKAGVSCVSCHGRVDRMEVVHQEKSLSMGFCLDCHRHPEDALRPHEYITKLGWQAGEGSDAAAAQRKIGLAIKTAKNIHPVEECRACHH